MNDQPADIRKVLSYGREKLARQYLTFSAIAAAVGLVGVLVSDGDTELTVVAWVLLVGGTAWIAWEFSKTTRRQKPLLVLSPEGIRMRIEGATDFLIPWPEVKGIGRIDIEAGNATLPDVTVVLVTDEFYDRVIHVDSLFLRGPGWGAIFIPREDGLVQVALHEAYLPVDADELHAAVEARWRAFGGKAAQQS